MALSGVARACGSVRIGCSCLKPDFAAHPLDSSMLFWGSWGCASAFQCVIIVLDRWRCLVSRMHLSPFGLGVAA
eukprot:5776120-Amphidinium_carterae.9